MTPTLIPELKQIKNLATGVNHVLALNQKGRVFAWGAGEQSQLARRVVARTAIGALVPREFGLQRKTIVNIGCGDYHSFAVDKNGDVFAWGLNTFGQTGIVKDDDEDDTVHAPTVIENLKGKDIKQITGGAHHTLSCTKDGEVLLWGRVDNNQGGMDVDEMPKDSIYFDPINKRARYLEKPLTIPDIKGAFIATASDTCFVISEDGKAYSWGFSTNYQTAQGTDEDVIEASVVENSAVRGKKLVFAGVGGQFGVLGGVSTEMTNGV
jgi:regulator of chromosome condensation